MTSDVDVLVRLRDISLDLSWVNLAGFEAAEMAVSIAQAALIQAQAAVVRTRRDTLRTKLHDNFTNVLDTL